jgi:VanZ family protein
MRRPSFWFAAFLCWIAAMWWLSSSPKPFGNNMPEIPHIDKALHFGWFMGGSILLSSFLMLKGKRSNKPRAVHAAMAVSLIALLGAIDEWHQSYVPGRSGNDPGDWTADIAGALVGVMIFRRTGGILVLDVSDSVRKGAGESP